MHMASTEDYFLNFRENVIPSHPFSDTGDSPFNFPLLLLDFGKG